MSVRALAHGNESRGLQSYRAVLAIPGVRAPLMASALGSLPIGMYVLGVLLLARHATGSFGEAGRVAAAFGLANALGAVAQGRAMDRFGQSRTLRSAAASHAAAVAALVVAARSGASTAVLIACAAASGGSLPQLPAAMRALWPTLVGDGLGRQTGYAIGAIVFEVAVVTAPALVAGIVAVGSPPVAVVVAAAIATAAALAFSCTPASRCWRGASHASGWLGPLASPGMRTVVGALSSLGAAIGVVQVAVIAFTAQRGSAELGGVLLAALSAGSLVGGLVYGARSWPGRPPARLFLVLAGLGAGCALLATAGSPPVLGVMLVAVGLLLAPASIIGSSLLDVVAPAGTMTEAFSVMVMGIVAGTAAGTALGGTIVDDISYEAAVATAAAIAACGAAFVLRRHRTLRSDSERLRATSIAWCRVAEHLRVGCSRPIPATQEAPMPAQRNTRKLVESTFVTLDGVISNPQVWGGAKYWDDEYLGYASDMLFAADALLLGRETYEGFAAAWPGRPANPYTDRINALPKHVASRTLQKAEWNATVIQGDVAERVAELKRQPGADLLKFGTGELDRTLLEHGLIDELHLWIFPVVAGEGERLLEGIDTTYLELLKTTTFASGIVVHVYGSQK